MVRISLGDVWQETAVFVRAEMALIMPVALAAFGLPVVVVQLLIPDRIGPDTVYGPWMWALLPYALCSMIGSLAIASLALRPGLSVQEALTRAVRRLPVAIGVALLVVAAVMVAMTIVSIVAGIEMATLGRSGPVFAIALFGLFAAILSLLVRILPVWALVAARDDGSITALRTAFRATRGRFLRLLLLRVVAWVSQTMVLLVVWMPFAAILNLLGHATGAMRLGSLLALIAGGLIMAGILATWSVYVARLSRLLASSNGI